VEQVDLVGVVQEASFGKAEALAEIPEQQERVPVVI
jgi:hypothetical protein